jgi:hypothetical protein
LGAIAQDHDMAQRREAEIGRQRTISMRSHEIREDLSGSLGMTIAS